LYKDIDARTTSKVPLPTLNDLYNAIHHSDYPNFMPHNDPEVSFLDDEVFPNIK
jgi:hypothetical protein